MKLSLNIPKRHIQDFIGYSDFQVIDFLYLEEVEDLYDQLPEDFEIWLNPYSYELFQKHLVKMKRFSNVKKILLPATGKPFFQHCFRMWQEVREALGREIEPLGVWDITTTLDLGFLESAFGKCALCWNKPRKVYLKNNEERRKDPIFLGLQNLEELAVYKPAHLHTSIPIMAAYYGIDIRDRKRRPKHLEFDAFAKLEPISSELAISNILADKEAGHAGQD